MTIRQESKCSINVSKQLSRDKATIVSFCHQVEVVAPGSKSGVMYLLHAVRRNTCTGQRGGYSEEIVCKCMTLRTSGMNETGEWEKVKVMVSFLLSYSVFDFIFSLFFRFWAVR